MCITPTLTPATALSPLSLCWGTAAFSLRLEIRLQLFLLLLSSTVLHITFIYHNCFNLCPFVLTSRSCTTFKPGSSYCKTHSETHHPPPGEEHKHQQEPCSSSHSTFLPQPQDTNAELSAPFLATRAHGAAVPKICLAEAAAQGAAKHLVPGATPEAVRGRSPAPAYWSPSAYWLGGGPAWGLSVRISKAASLLWAPSQKGNA